MFNVSWQYGKYQAFSGAYGLYGNCSIRSVHKELVVGTLKVVEIKGMPMQREFNFVQLQGQEGGLSQVFMRFAGHHSKSL